MFLALRRLAFVVPRVYDVLVSLIVFVLCVCVARNGRIGRGSGVVLFALQVNLYKRFERFLCCRALELS